MGLGVGFAQQIAGLLLGYLAFVLIASLIAIFLAKAINKAWPYAFIPVAFVLPVLVVMGKIDHQSRLQKEYEKKSAIALRHDRALFEKICTWRLSVQVLATTVAEEDKIMVLDEEKLSRAYYPYEEGLASMAVFEGSPFSSALERFPLDQNQPGCKVPGQGSRPCRDPEYGYFPWPATAVAKPIFELPQIPRYTLRMLAPVPREARLRRREIVLIDNGKVLARSFVHELGTDGGYHNSCPGYPHVVQTMIIAAFAGKLPEVGSVE